MTATDEAVVGADDLSSLAFPPAGGPCHGWMAPLLAWVSGWWGARLIGFLQCAVFAVGVLFALVGCHALVELVAGPMDFLAWLLLPVVLFAGTAIHEYGHVLGARASGMTPFLMKIGPLQFIARRGGWRMRWQRPERGYAGYVTAFINPCVSLRRQQLVMIAAGPFANLMAACVLGMPGLYLIDSNVGVFLVGVAAFNLAVALGNLLPTKRSMANDGMQMLAWLQGFPGDGSEFAVEYLNGLAIRGVTADRLPPDLLARLEGQPQPLPLLHSWFLLKAHQNRGEWAAAAAIGSQFETQVAGLPVECRPSLENLVAVMRCEAAFSGAMAGRCPDHPIDRDLGAENDWLAPGLRARLQALMAVRAGDRLQALSCLEASERLVSRSIDKARVISESRIRAAITAELRKLEEKECRGQSRFSQVRQSGAD